MDLTPFLPKVVAKKKKGGNVKRMREVVIHQNHTVRMVIYVVIVIAY